MPPRSVHFHLRGPSAQHLRVLSIVAERPRHLAETGHLRAETRNYVERIVHTTAHAFLLFFSNRGRVYRLKAHEIPMKDRTARGTAMPNLLSLAPGERIQAIIDTRDYETNRFLFFATKQGQVKKTKFTEYDSSLRAAMSMVGGTTKTSPMRSKRFALQRSVKQARALRWRAVRQSSTRIVLSMCTTLSGGSSKR